VGALAGAGPQGQIAESSWGLVQNVESSVCRILALDLKANGLLSHSLSALTSVKLASTHLYEDRWLQAYEAPTQVWIKNTKHITGDPWFAQLQAKKVRFYKPSYKLKPLFQMKKADSVKGMDAKQLAFLKNGSMRQLSRSVFDPTLFLNFNIVTADYENRDVGEDDYEL
jgi:hypothetical protein